MLYALYVFSYFSDIFQLLFLPYALVDCVHGEKVVFIMENIKGQSEIRCIQIWKYKSGGVNSLLFGGPKLMRNTVSKKMWFTFLENMTIAANVPKNPGIHAGHSWLPRKKSFRSRKREHEGIRVRARPETISTRTSVFTVVLVIQFNYLPSRFYSFSCIIVFRYLYWRL